MNSDLLQFTQQIDAHAVAYKMEDRDESATNFSKLVIEHLMQDDMIPKDLSQMIYHDETPDDQFTFFRYQDSAHPFLVMASQTQSAVLATSDTSAPEMFYDIKQAWDAFMDAGRPTQDKPAAEEPQPQEADKPAAEEPQPQEADKPAAEEPQPQEADKPAE